MTTIMVLAQENCCWPPSSLATSTNGQKNNDATINRVTKTNNNNNKTVHSTSGHSFVRSTLNGSSTVDRSPTSLTSSSSFATVMDHHQPPSSSTTPSPSTRFLLSSDSSVLMSTSPSSSVLEDHKRSFSACALSLTDSSEFMMGFLERKPYRPFRSNEEYLVAMKEDLAEWFNTLYQIDCTADNFMSRLETGIILCKHANSVLCKAREWRMLNGYSPFAQISLTELDLDRNVPIKMNALAGTFQARDNVANFIQWCRRIRIHECLLFETEDLVARKNEKSFVLCLLEVARYGAKFGFLAPTLVRFEQEIDQELENEQKQQQQEREANSPPNQMARSSGQTRSQMTNHHHHHHHDGIIRREDFLQENQMTTLLPQEPQPQITNNDLESLHEKVVNLLSRCTCPVQFYLEHLSEGKYRIGDTKTLIFVRILRNHVMVRVGGGWDTLEHYLEKHDPCRCRFGHRYTGSTRPNPTAFSHNSPVHCGAIKAASTTTTTTVSPQMQVTNERSDLHNRSNMMGSTRRLSSVNGSPVSNRRLMRPNSVTNNLSLMCGERRASTSSNDSGAGGDSLLLSNISSALSQNNSVATANNSLSSEHCSSLFSSYSGTSLERSSDERRQCGQSVLPDRNNNIKGFIDSSSLLSSSSLALSTSSSSSTSTTNLPTTTAAAKKNNHSFISGSQNALNKCLPQQHQQSQQQALANQRQISLGKTNNATNGPIVSPNKKRVLSNVDTNCSPRIMKSKLPVPLAAVGGVSKLVGLKNSGQKPLSSAHKMKSTSSLAISQIGASRVMSFDHQHQNNRFMAAQSKDNIYLPQGMMMRYSTANIHLACSQQQPQANSQQTSTSVIKRSTNSSSLSSSHKHTANTTNQRCSLAKQKSSFDLNTAGYHSSDYHHPFYDQQQNFYNPNKFYSTPPQQREQKTVPKSNLGSKVPSSSSLLLNHHHYHRRHHSSSLPRPTVSSASKSANNSPCSKRKSDSGSISDNNNQNNANNNNNTIVHRKLPSPKKLSKSKNDSKCSSNGKLITSSSTSSLGFKKRLQGSATSLNSTASTASSSGSSCDVMSAASSLATSQSSNTSPQPIIEPESGSVPDDDVSMSPRAILTEPPSSSSQPLPTKRYINVEATGEPSTTTLVEVCSWLERNHHI